MSEKFAIVIPIGPGADAAIDTLESIEFYCQEPHIIVIVDDHTTDGTYEKIISVRKGNWFILRNDRVFGIQRLVHTLCKAYKFVLENSEAEIILRIDQDALITGYGILTDANNFLEMNKNKNIGLFGVYDIDYNRPRSFESHRKLINRETHLLKRMIGLTPFWYKYLKIAEETGYKRGENVFGGAYFLTRECLSAIKKIGALDVPYHWKSRLMEDVYFSMVAVASGRKLCHFAVPTWPICLDWQGMPYPAPQILEKGYKIVHSVDKGKNTDPPSNNGISAREYFKRNRTKNNSLRLKTN